MEKILVLDFGGQYNQLIARKVREQHVYAEIKSYRRITVKEIAQEGYKGIIFTGGPNDVYEESSPHYAPEVLGIGVPVLGICYGAQLIAWMAGGRVSSAGNRSEYGKVDLHVRESALFTDIPEKSVCWMSHSDYISSIPEGFEVTAVTKHCSCAAMENASKKIYGVQFHPEVTHTECGRKIFRCRVSIIKNPRVKLKRHSRIMYMLETSNMFFMVISKYILLIKRVIASAR